MSKGIDNGANKLQIKEFTLNEMVKDPSIIMIAKRGSGKSWVARAILHHFRKIPVGIIIAPTDRMNSFYGKFFPNSYIFYEYKTEIIEKILARQIMIIKKAKEKKEIGQYVNTKAFIIMDDCLGQKKSWANDRPVQELLFNGRHYRIMYILTMQYPLGISPDLRSNFDYIFLLAEDTISNLKRIFDHYAGIFPDFGSFRQVFSQLTDDFGSMVIINRGARKSFLEKVKWYKAPAISVDDSSFGCKQFRKFNRENYDESWEDRVKLFDINEFVYNKKKDKSKLAIEKLED